MMLSVTFSQPIVIDAANLHSLLSLANAPAVVEPVKVFEVVAAPRAGRKPRLTNPKAEPEAAPTDTPAPEKAKRTRRTKAEMLAAKEQASPSDGAGAAATTEAEPAAEAAPVADAPVKKRGRKPKAEAAPKSTGAAEAGASGTAPDTAAMLERFAKLIDADFGKAKSALDEFGVNRFSDLKPDQLGAFNAKLTELGV